MGEPKQSKTEAARWQAAYRGRVRDDLRDLKLAVAEVLAVLARIERDQASQVKPERWTDA